MSRLAGYPEAKGFQPIGHQIHRHTFPKISKPVGHPLFYSPAVIRSPFFPSTKPCKTPQQHISAGNIHPPRQATQKQPVWLFLALCLWNKRHLSCSSQLWVLSSLDPYASTGEARSTHIFLPYPLTQGASGSLLCCRRAALGAKGAGVLQIWTPNPLGAHKILGLT